MDRASEQDESVMLTRNPATPEAVLAAHSPALAEEQRLPAQSFFTFARKKSPMSLAESFGAELSKMIVDECLSGGVIRSTAAYRKRSD